MEHLIIINSRGKLYRRVPGISSLNSKFMSKLAASMVAPLRRKIDYHDIAKKAISVEPLPQGALPIYDKDIDIVSALFNKTKGFRHKKIVISSRGKVGKYSNGILGQRLTIPTFEIVSTPTINISEVKRRRFNLIDRVQRGFKHNKIFISSRGKASFFKRGVYLMNQVVQQAKQQIMEQEDENIFKALDAASNIK